MSKSSKPRTIPCPDCGKRYAIDSWDAIAIAGSFHCCLECLQWWAECQPPSNQEEFEERYGLTVADLPGGIHDGRG